MQKNAATIKLTQNPYCDKMMGKLTIWWRLKALLLLILTTNRIQTQAAHILAVLPSVWKSHYLFGHHILSQLVEQHNHSITLISPYQTDDMYIKNVSKEKFKEIKVEGLLSNWIEMGLSFDMEEMHEKSVMEHFTRLIYATTSNTDRILQNIQVRKLLQSPQKFDLLIVDLFLSDALLGLSFYYQVPTVVLSPSGSNTWLNQRFGNPQNAALDPSNFLPYSKDMSFWQRCVNTLMAMFEKLTYSFFHMISQQAVYTKHFEPLCQLADWCQQLPHHKELTENLSLALINTHPVLQYPRAFLPNMLSVAGIHLVTSRKDLELPNHVEQFIKEARNGVIYMSFGANVYDFPIEKMELFFDVFETLPEMRFIIKYDKQYPLRTTQKFSSQILIHNWWPQQAILSHENVKLFITSGGFMSITEALYFEKSILTIPITSEQYVLCENLNTQNAAYVLNYNDLTYDQVIYGIKQMLANNSNYKQSMKKLKRQLMENLESISPLAKTLNAIEMTLRTNGLNYLKPHSHHLSFWSSILLDVMFILIAGLLTIIAIPFLLTCCILKRSYQNQSKLNQQKHRYHWIPITSQKACNNGKCSDADHENDVSMVWQERCTSLNTDAHEHRKRCPSNSSSCCNCPVTTSAPNTPISKREASLCNRACEDTDKNI